MPIIEAHQNVVRNHGIPVTYAGPYPTRPQKYKCDPTSESCPPRSVTCNSNTSAANHGNVSRRFL